MRNGVLSVRDNGAGINKEVKALTGGAYPLVTRGYTGARAVRCRWVRVVAPVTAAPGTDASAEIERQILVRACSYLARPEG